MSSNSIMYRFLPYIIGLALLNTIVLEGANTPVIFSPESDPRVLLFYGGKWGYICAGGWDSKAAKVVCRMKGHWHGEGRAVFKAYEPGNTIVLSSIKCTGDESDINQCTNSGLQTLASCPGGSVAAIDCSITDHSIVRLVDGYGHWEGRVEIRVKDGDWRPACADSWTNEDARVVCRQLGIRGDVGKAHVDGKYGVSSSPALITQTKCLGSEPNLSSCPAALVNNGSCSRQAGVECYDCGNEYTTEAGIVQSKNYPSQYPGNENCLDVINPPSDGRLYKLSFTDFQTEDCCDKLTVTVLEGKKTISSIVYTGASTPPAAIGTSFQLQFLSDGTHGERGFQAKWGVTGIADTVTASCQDGKFNITANLPLLKRIYPFTNLSSIALADPSCQGVVHGDNLIISYNISQCGSKIATKGDLDIYSNYIVERIFDRKSDLIVRGHRWRLPISCSVVKKQNLSFHYTPFSPTKKRREVTSSIHVNKNFEVLMDLYQDQTMTMRETDPVYKLGKDLFIRVVLKHTMATDVKLVVNECFANPTPDIDFMRYTLINNSCEIDSRTHFIQRAQKYTDFKMNFFEFAGDFSHVYLECDVSICLQEETTGQCAGSCSPSSSKREVEYHDASKQETVRVGPLLVHAVY